MDRIFSTRMNDDLVRRVNRFVRERSMTKKGLIEKALREYLDRIDSDHEAGILARSFGSWKREEAPEDTLRKARDTFNEGFRRHSEKGSPE